MSRADVLTTTGHAWEAPAHPASRAALGVAIVLALLVAAAFSFAARGGEQAAPDEIAQLGD